MFKLKRKTKIKYRRFLASYLRAKDSCRLNYYKYPTLSVKKSDQFWPKYIF